MSFKTPIRVKFMLTFLVLVTAVVGLITFTTTNLFRDDKQTYVNGLTSMVAVGTAEEARSTLAGYRERLDLYARILLEDGFAEQESLSQMVFDEFHELVAVVVDSGGGEPSRVFNISMLGAIDRTPEDVTRLIAERSRPEGPLAAGETWIRNASLTPKWPAFLLAFSRPTDDGDTVHVSALLRSARLQQLVTRFSAYEQFLVDSASHFLAHPDLELVRGDEIARLADSARQVRESFSAGVTAEHEKDGVPTIGAYADLDFGRVLAGAEIPKSAANLASRQILNRMLLVAAVLLVVAIIASVLFAHRLTRPMERLTHATRTIARGDFDVEVRVESRDEMGQLAASFNQMARELTEREQALLQANAQLVQSEKMAAFGQLGAGIAHEVKNPLAGILACVQLAADEVAEESAVYQDLKLIEKESKRCKSIIENLLKFARQEKAAMSETDVNHVIEDSIAIVNHQLELNEVRAERDLQNDLPPVLANANQLQQVFMNLMINAQQAMSGTPGKIKVSTRAGDDGRVRVRFADTGPGIPEGIRGKLFEPFFTTKPPGQGTGLGLSVSYGIIRDHQGEITVESEIGVGSTFEITLPLHAVEPVAIDPAAIGDAPALPSPTV